MKNGIVLYQDHLHMARGLLTDEELGSLICALIDHVDGKQVELDEKGKAWLACYDVMSEAADENVRKYLEKCEKNRENGNLGGRPKKPNGFSDNQTVSDENHMVSGENPIKEKKEKEKKNENNKREGEFAPPSPGDVRAYCLKNGYNVDEYVFCNFYAANGWRIGNRPMVDWQAAVRTWESRGD